MVELDEHGHWTDAYRTFVDGIRDSDDIQHVLGHLTHPDPPVRLAVAQWFGFGDVHWTGLGIDPAGVPSQMRRAPMPHDVETVLVRDPDPTVASAAVLRANDVPLLIDVILNTDTHPWVRRPATSRVLTLDRLDDLMAASGPDRPLPLEAARELARHSTRTDVLEDLLAVDVLRDDLLANPALTPEQLTALIGSVPPGRPPGGPPEWAGRLRAAAESFAAAGDWQNPGGFEAAELRECGPAGGRLLAAAAPLCAAAADALATEDDAPEWAVRAVTWALELSRAHADPASVYPRLAISPRRVAPHDIPPVPEIELRAAARRLRARQRIDVERAALAAGAAALLDALADGEGSLDWLRRYGGGNGYDDLHAFAILALSSSGPLRSVLDD